MIPKNSGTVNPLRSSAEWFELRRSGVASSTRPLVALTGFNLDPPFGVKVNSPTLQSINE